MSKVTSNSRMLDDIRKQVIDKYGTFSAYGAKHNISGAYISMILNGNREVPVWMAREFGYTRIIESRWERR